MTNHPSATIDRVLGAVTEAYRAAGLEVGGGAGTVAPLARLLKAHGIIADEVEGLTRRSAAAYLAAQAGRDMTTVRGKDESLAGFLYASAAGGWILVNRSDPLARRRFSVAHELGHFVLHFQPLLDDARTGDERDLLTLDEALPPADDADTGRGHVTVRLDMVSMQWIPSLEDSEEEANQFAAAVLMPEPVCRTLIATFAPRYGQRRETLARRLMSECLVSRAAMLRRLSNLGLP